MGNISYYTEKGLKELRDKLAQLKDVERPRASQAIAEARDKGDLSENAEYDAAKEAQGMLELEISKLEETLSNARIIDESKLDSSKVLVHSTVKIKNLTNSAVMEYKLVAQSEANLAQGKISVSDLKPLEVSDLLGREPAKAQEDLLKGNIKSKVVMVTGAGGSIGSELSRQILKIKPKLLILFEISEVSLYMIEQELINE